MNNSDLNQIRTAIKEEIKDAFFTFTEDVFVPALDNVFEKTTIEIRQSEQRVRDYTDKRVGETEGKITLKLKEAKDIFQAHKDKDENFKKETVNIFSRNKLINDKEKEGLAVSAS